MSHATRAHAKNSPSAAYRWMNCPGSSRMAEGIERKSSIYADEGTAAHILAERCLTLGCDAAGFAGRVVDIHGEGVTVILAAGSPLHDGRFEIDEEMVDGVQLFVDTVRAAIEDGDAVRIEHRVHFSGDDEFGTSDATVYQRRHKRIQVFDLKYGAGVLVEVKDNPQLICYAEGARREFENEKDIVGLDVTIVQPRMPHRDGPVRMVSIGPLELLDWSLDIDAAVARTEAPDAPLVPGDWCKWCPGAGRCPALASKALAVAIEDFEDIEDFNPIALPVAESLSPVTLGKLLDGFGLLDGWITSVRQFAYAEAEAGRPVPGHKLVDKIGRRAWESEGEALRRVAAMGVDANDCFTRKFKSPAQIEKLTGKKDFAKELADLCPVKSSGTTLVPLSDKRSAVSRRIEDHFEEIDE